MPQSHATSTGITLTYDQTGSSGFPLVLLHGLSSSRHAFATLNEHLAPGIARGEVQTFAVDMRGHGDSTWASLDTYDAISYASDIAAFIRELNLAPAIVVGHSLGAVVAASLAHHHRQLVHALFLEDPPFFEGDDARRNASPVAAIFPKVVAETRALQARNAPVEDYATFMPPHEPDPEGRKRTLQKWDPTTMEAAATGIVWHGFDPLRSLNVPTTIVRADETCGAVFWQADELLVRKANPHVNIAQVVGADHMVRHSKPAAFFAIFDRFLASVLA